jgi:D-2-hydroxyglutarate dehydrogenase
VLDTFAAASADLAEVLSAVEFLDAESFGLVTAHGAVDPLGAEGGDARHYMLVELSGSNAEHDAAKLEAFLERVLGDGSVSNGAIAQDGAQMAAMWRIREGITEALARTGAVYKYDVSAPLAELYALVEEMRARLQPLGAAVSGFGHLGDGNLHLNIVTPEAFDRRADVTHAIEPFVYEWIAQRRGSISAEHGVGAMKPHVLHMSKTPEMIALMRSVKALFDPRGILNPHKVLPP